MAAKPLRTFHVYRKIDGKVTFWMNARGVSCKQVWHAVWYNNRNAANPINKSDILVIDPKGRA